ncbi:Glyoxalase ElbB [Diplonema papillatum]|nr:Glyoxalase ElbB [Diplonema papillatum]
MLRATRASCYRAAVLLAGNGVYDGSETTEAVSLLVGLSRQGATVTMYSVDKPQAHVVNHTNGKEMPETRNVLVESARIARGAIVDISKLKAADHDALFMPGGFGVAKNFSDFGFKGADMAVDPAVEAVLKEFHAAKKPLGLCCIAPIVAAKVFGRKSGGPGLTLTLGCRGDAWPYQGSIDAAESFGNELKECDMDATCFDKKNKLVTAPAYMKENATPHEVFTPWQNDLTLPNPKHPLNALGDYTRFHNGVTSPETSCTGSLFPTLSTPLHTTVNRRL